MKRKVKYKRAKHGASTIFLSIILSALILVECTFLAFVWNLDYALSVNTALKTQMDTILSDYNRQLFAVYGVYAFSMDSVDNYCFDKALEINGLDSKSTLYCCGETKITSEDLRTAIASYYWYRGTGISFKSLVDGYSNLLIELDKNDVIGKVGKFMKSPAAGYVSEMIKGSETVEEWFNKAGGVINIEDYLDESDDLNAIKSDFNDVIHESDLGIDVDIADWEGILNTVSFIESVVDTASDESMGTMSKFTTAHYCAYNFDCWIPPEGDASINGTLFKSIHGSRCADSEYIITGMEKNSAVFSIEFMILHVLILGNYLKDYADEKIRNTIYAISEVISMIIYAVSEGAADIDPRIIAAGLTLYVAMVQALKGFFDILQGQRATFFEYDGKKMITLNYRDFLYLLALTKSEDDMLGRTLEVLTRDYGDLYKGLTLEADFRGSTYSIGKCYQLYE